MGRNIDAADEIMDMEDIGIELDQAFKAVAGLKVIAAVMLGVTMKEFSGMSLQEIARCIVDKGG